METGDAKSFILGNAALVVWGDVNSNEVDEAALNDWWTNEHLSERLSVPGFERARRYFSHDESSNTTKYLTLYEASDLNVLTSPAYMEKLNNPTLGTQQHIPTLATMQRSACSLVHSEARRELQPCGTGIGATMAMLVLSLPSSENIDDVRVLLSKKFSVLQHSSMTAMNLIVLQEDKATTDPGSSSQSYLNVKLKPSDDGDIKKCFALLEFSTSVRHPVGGVQRILKPLWGELATSYGKDAITAYDVYEVMCSVRA